MTDGSVGATSYNYEWTIPAPVETASAQEVVEETPIFNTVDEQANVSGLSDQASNLDFNNQEAVQEYSSEATAFVEDSVNQLTCAVELAQNTTDAAYDFSVASQYVMATEEGKDVSNQLNGFTGILNTQANQVKEDAKGINDWFIDPNTGISVLYANSGDPESVSNWMNNVDQTETLNQCGAKEVGEVNSEATKSKDENGAPVYTFEDGTVVTCGPDKNDQNIRQFNVTKDDKTTTISFDKDGNLIQAKTGTGDDNYTEITHDEKNGSLTTTTKKGENQSSITSSFEQNDDGASITITDASATVVPNNNSQADNSQEAKSASELSDGKYGSFEKKGDKYTSLTDDSVELSEESANKLLELNQEKIKEDTLSGDNLNRANKDRDAIGYHNDENNNQIKNGLAQENAQGYQWDTDKYFDENHGDSNAKSVKELSQAEQDKYVNAVSAEMVSDMSKYLGIDQTNDADAAKLKDAFADAARQTGIDISGIDDSKIVEEVTKELAYRSWDGRLDNDYVDINSIQRGLTDKEREIIYPNNVTDSTASAETPDTTVRYVEDMNETYGISKNEQNNTVSVAGISGLNLPSDEQVAQSILDYTHGKYELTDDNGNNYTLNIADNGWGNPETYTLTYTDADGNIVERKYEQGTSTLTDTIYAPDGETKTKTQEVRQYNTAAGDKHCKGVAVTTTNYDEDSQVSNVVVNKTTEYDSGTYTASVTEYDKDGNEESYTMRKYDSAEAAQQNPDNYNSETKSATQYENGNMVKTLNQGGSESKVEYNSSGYPCKFTYQGTVYEINNHNGHLSFGGEIFEEDSDLYKTYMKIIR